jgi:hypothetical protein
MFAMPVITFIRTLIPRFTHHAPRTTHHAPPQHAQHISRTKSTYEEWDGSEIENSLSVSLERHLAGTVSN